jgi:PhnB protein
MSTAKPVPDGFNTATPYLIVPDGKAALGFYQRAFGATITTQLIEPGGRLMHATIKIGDSLLMLGEHTAVDPRGEKTFPRVSIYLYVDDVDSWAARAGQAGAKVLMPVTDHFYGDRSGGFEDPYGIVWWISTHKEDLTDEEIMRRAATARPQHA